MHFAKNREGFVVQDISTQKCTAKFLIQYRWLLKKKKSA